MGWLVKTYASETTPCVSANASRRWRFSRRDNINSYVARPTAVVADSPAPLLLTHLIHAIFDLLASDPSFWSLFYMLRSQPEINRTLDGYFRQWTYSLRDLFADKFREYGRAEPALDAYVLYCLVEGTIQQYLLEPDSYPLDAVVARILDQFNLPAE